MASLFFKIRRYLSLPLSPLGAGMNRQHPLPQQSNQFCFFHFVHYIVYLSEQRREYITSLLACVIADKQTKNCKWITSDRIVPSDTDNPSTTITAANDNVEIRRVRCITKHCAVMGVRRTVDARAYSLSLPPRKDCGMTMRSCEHVEES